jgi:hypothetical protein
MVSLIVGVVLLIIGSDTASAAYTKEAVKDFINDIPGAEKLDIPFKTFSGYLDGNVSNGSSLVITKF